MAISAPIKKKDRPKQASRLAANKDLLTAGIATAALVLLSVCFGRDPSRSVTVAPRGEIRLAYFPNLTHAVALAGIEDGTFQSATPQYRIAPKVVNAGPEAMEALLAGEIDLAYVGPSPAVNTYLKSGGKALKILAGACSGGASLVARSGVSIRSIPDLAGKRVAVPQLGGTQDVSLRHFLEVNGLAPKDKGGSVEVLPVKNPDILTLFFQKQIDAAWVPEPWASRLIAETHARTIVDEASLWPNHRFTTTVLVVRSSFESQHPDAVEEVLQAHNQIVSWLNGHPAEGQKVVNSSLKKLTGKSLKESVLTSAWSHLTFTVDPNPASILAMADAAQRAGYLHGRIDLSRAYSKQAIVNWRMDEARRGR
jgi:NitT/TauT family transport system substrate-binding protein